MWPLLMGTEGPELSLNELMPSMLVAVYCGVMSAIIVCMTYFKLNRSKKIIPYGHFNSVHYMQTAHDGISGLWCL